MRRGAEVAPCKGGTGAAPPEHYQFMIWGLLEVDLRYLLIGGGSGVVRQH